MFKSILDDVRYQFQSGNTITRLIMVNVGIFLVAMIFKIALNLSAGLIDQTAFFKHVMGYLFLAQDLLWDVKHPWAIITHMFTHIGFFHILFNMLVLYWFGRISGDLLGDHRMFPLYIYSGLAGALVYLLSAPLFHPGGISTLHGASAAIMGIVAAAGITAPDYQVRLLFLGDVRLKYIVLALIIISFFSAGNLDNPGGNMAHIGGAAFGFFYVHLLRQGYDLTNGFRRLLNALRRPSKTTYKPVKRRVPLKVRHASGTERARSSSPAEAGMDDQERLNTILEKIKKSGINSLDDEEKQFLDDASQK